MQRGGQGKDRPVCLMLGSDLKARRKKAAEDPAPGLRSWLPVLTKSVLCNALLSGIQVQKHFTESHAVPAEVIVSDNEKSLSAPFSCLNSRHERAGPRSPLGQVSRLQSLLSFPEGKDFS